MDIESLDFLLTFLDRVSNAEELMGSMDLLPPFLKKATEELSGETVDLLTELDKDAVVKQILKQGNGYDKEFVSTLIQTITNIATSPGLSDAELLEIARKSLFSPLGINAKTIIPPTETLTLISPTQSQPLRPVGVTNPPKEIGNYKVWHKLGSGSCADVYLASPKSVTMGDDGSACSPLRVAIKCVKSGEKGLEAELSAAQSISSPFVVKLYSHGELPRKPYVGYLVFELCHFGPLSSFPKTLITEHLRALWVYQLAHGVKAIHDSGHIHGGLKPSNLLIDRQGTLKIGDFGLARDLNATRPQTESGVQLGTLTYMSPEQLREESATKQSDLWSFGAILYELFRGAPLFSSLKQLEVYRQRLDADQELSFEGIPEELIPVIQRCLEPQLTARYESMDECWAALSPYINRTLISHVQEKQRGLWGALQADVNAALNYCSRRAREGVSEGDEAQQFLTWWDEGLLTNAYTPMATLSELLTRTQERLTKMNGLRAERDAIEVQSPEEITREVDAALNQSVTERDSHTLKGLEELLDEMKGIQRGLMARRAEAEERRAALDDQFEHRSKEITRNFMRSIDQQLSPALHWNGAWIDTVGLEAPKGNELRPQRALKVSFAMTPFEVKHEYEYMPTGLLSKMFKSPEPRAFTERRLRHCVIAEELDIFTLSFCPPGQLLSGERIERTFARGYWVMTTPVTRKLWRGVMGNDPSPKSLMSAPVTNITWHDALRFANALSILDRRAPCYYLKTIEGGRIEVTCDHEADGYRLPTAQEWRYAAQAGERHDYSGSDDLDAVGWYSGNSGKSLQPVAKKQANAWSIYDMSGNVSEWVADPESTQVIKGGKRFDEVPHFTYSLSHPSRYALGGNYMMSEGKCPISNSYQTPSSTSADYIGLRLVVAPSQLC